MSFPGNQSYKRALFTYVLIFILGSLTVLFLQKLQTRLSSCMQTYYLLNPVFRCNDATLQGEWDYEPLRDVLSTKKEEFKTSGQLSHLSIYFRDLNHGPRFGIGEYDKFQPASLTKLPVLITYLHAADLDARVLEKTLSFTGSLDVNENVELSGESIESDTAYTVRELLTKMIRYSDNYSYKLLMRDLNDAPRIIAYYTFRDLDVLRMMLSPKADYVSIQSYANLFPVLYNTGYLSREMSQFALELLSHTTFTDGLVAGVPQNIRVAHKFGHRILGPEHQLHDCGIVYHPAMSYLLCVMTSGANPDNLEAAIAEVSHIVYDAMSSLHLDSPPREYLENIQ